MLAGIAFNTLNPSLAIVMVLLVIGLAYGYFFVMPIGGADMPVVISLLNSFSGITAMLTGAIFNNNMMLLGGTLVGAAGIILTILMSQAMNRSVANILKGNFGGSSATAQGGDANLVIKEVTANDLAIQMKYAQKIMFVPGYGLAVAQAQGAVKELDQILNENDVDIRYGIHPVAGRMPGHMNVLLAEADIPYEKLLDLDETNQFLEDCDLAIVVGANDVVNPSALDDKSSPLYGMPILNVLRAKQVVVVKRGMKPGYAGIENPLFYKDNNKMLFGDAKAVINAINKELKNL
ncbi:unnamed protein product [Cyprideis torosa]|uniref:proton-translocating NAD(P)(+) transhydrogenase n=1 Tax=Cyprideis torosa TaxID=163714 RepID=A0A7R8WQ63_9CRUS|nr:unnamed protein product [Cyprideis torosa]CAG0907738.1 unnamed protein product [Cyprideis torosa]